ncbi:YecA family protein [Salibacterium halotolerans]|uniref:SEC-C motif-containing protein n=1 Tax=Salibacterium halotolerans TaxID=1884432 RepID=A0A1I5S1G5_9BACI|nr:SEC-C metal-binding domain-containing protein [Salibacterium halotolerans]SFP64628.1 SEC-C motif-containing protein [Salibacterium halotolerans]
MSDASHDEVLEALEQLHSDMQEADKKRRQRMWKQPASYPCSLRDALTGITKQQMDGIRAELKLRNISNLKKVDLVEALVERIPQALPDQLRLLSGRQLRLLQTVDDDGRVPADEINFFEMHVLLIRGFVFPAVENRNQVVMMPKEVQKVFREHDTEALQQKTARNDDINLLIQGMLFYYGVMNILEVPEAVNAYLTEEEQVGAYECFTLIHKVMREDMTMVQNGNILADSDVTDPQQVLKEHKARPDLPYFPFTRQQLVQAGEDGVGETSPAADQFEQFLKEHYALDEMEAEDVVFHMEMMINDDVPMNDMLEEFQQWCEIPSAEVLQMVANQLTGLNNDTRQWILKGHTPNEAMQGKFGGGNVVPFPAGKRVGRNEPCPCGSGKKYKKCCGRR